MRFQNEKGAAMVEFSIILPLLAVILFGIVEFSLLLYNKQVITNASREGARAGIVAQAPRLAPAEIQQVVNDYAGSHLITFGTASAPVTTIDNSLGTAFGDDLTVTVSYKYDFLVLPNFIASLAGGVDLKAETVMRYE
jgi:Flp pilus assembly protein TadG